MKNNRKLIYFVFTVVVLALIGFFVFSQQNDMGIQNDENQIKEKTNINANSALVNNESSENTQNLPYGSPPKWAQSMMAINDNSSYTREDKIHKLADLLKQNESNSDALSALLISLTALNPLEAVNDIIPYLKNTNPKVQSAALGALNNASLLTEKEHELKKSLPENEAVRKRIAESVNELKAASTTSDEVKQALISTYASTNPSSKDTHAMNQEILKQDEISPNESSFVASSVLNGKEFSGTLSVLDKKDSAVKDSVINSIGTSIAENPDVISVPSTQQRTELMNFIRNNPPQGSRDNYSSQKDQWNNTLNILESRS
ncbi:HEAT repeat domain-containing protein [Acinetobacter pittii]|nr:HEAT repeat domain-containing protein [Acinetobacter pittii]